ncbi:MAG: TPM domain-containing protein [Methyloceanibacter sp.]
MAAIWRFGGLVLAMALALWLLPAAAEPKFPELTGRVVDDAGLLTYPEEVAITADLKALEDKSSDQVVVVTLPSLQGYTIEDFGYQLGRHWGIGTARFDNGVILIVASNERKVRIEVGRGLEGTLTDALSKIIIENGILPRFREGDFAGGIKDGVRDIILVLTGDAAEVEQRGKARRDADNPVIDWFLMILWLAIWLWIAYSIWRSVLYASRAGRSPGGPIFVPGTAGSGGGSGWSSGGGGNGGGGGFSGGGGSFGGGGASGGW